MIKLWNCKSNDFFMVKSYYDHLVENEVAEPKFPFQQTCKVNAPPWVAFFYVGGGLRVYFDNWKINEEGKIMVNDCFFARGRQSLVIILCFGACSCTSYGQ